MGYGLIERSGGGLSGPIAEEMLPSMHWFLNDSYPDCPDIFCNLLDEIGPPPDWYPLPPPLPPSLMQLLPDDNSSAIDDERTDSCNFCHVFANPIDSELVVPSPELKPLDSWRSLLIGSVLGSIILCIILLFILVKFRKWKLLSSVCGLNSCPIFPENVVRGPKDSPFPCTPPEDCISPVVNEKSPQSVITNCLMKTSLPSKYWRHSDEISASHEGMNDSRIPGELEEYTHIPEGSSCTSSPVYAELDAAGVAINHSQIPSSCLLNGPSPYAAHTYSEVVDESYDNVAYLPSSNSDHYQRRSSRRHRSARRQHGVATPLAPIPQQLMAGQQSNYLTSGRSHQKARPAYSHPTSRINTWNQHLSPLQQLQLQYQQQQRNPLEIDSRFLGSRRPETVYDSNLQFNSLSLATFRAAPYGDNNRENPKRPLPAVPGVRL